MRAYASDTVSYTHLDVYKRQLDDALTKIGEKMDYAIDVDVPDENIVNRMGGRLSLIHI